jgi:hypothetical protein
VYATGLIALLLASTAATNPSTNRADAFTIVSDDADKDLVAGLERDVVTGMARVRQFFGKPFEQRFVVEICPDRARFDEYFQRRWTLPKTERWMVASGVADRLVILSPRVWKTEAVEHDPADAQHIQELIAHELVHVFHGQHNPHPDFDGMDEMGWFVEGLAVLVSGQLENAHRTGASEAIKAGRAPKSLADAWSGRYRYAVCGSMVQFVEARFGRALVNQLLSVTSTAEALKLLNTSEQDFLEAWKAHVSGG